MHDRKLWRCWHAILLLSGSAAHPNARAALFTWEGACQPDNNWYACREIALSYYNNWFTSTVPEGCPESTFPGLADDVVIELYSVELAATAMVNSLSATGAFTLRDGGHGCGVWTHSTATWDDGTFDWEAGTLKGMAPGCVARLADQTRLRTGDPKNADSLLVRLEGRAVADGPGDLWIVDSVWNTTPEGQFEIEADMSIVGWAVNGPLGTLVNEGLFRKTAGALTVVGAPFYNQGTTSVESGTLRLTSGGSSTGSFHIDEGAWLDLAIHTLAENAMLAGGGWARVPGVPEAGWLTVADGGSVSIDHLEVAAGAWRLSGPGEVLIREQFRWNGGELTDAGSILIGQAALGQIGGAGWHTLGEFTIEVEGLLEWLSGDVSSPPWWVAMPPTVRVGSGGAFDILVQEPIASCGTAIFQNAGEVAKSGGDGVAIIGGETTNTGSVRAHAGTLKFDYRYTQTEGATLLDGGDLACRRDYPGDYRFRIFGGALEGEGTIHNAGVLIAGGEVRPGLPLGQLRVAGGLDWGGEYQQTDAGTLALELGGATAGIEYDQLAVESGHAILGGTLRVTLVGGYVPSVGAAFDLVTYASHEGAFAHEQLPTLDARRFRIRYRPTEVRLVSGLTGDMNCDGRVDFYDIDAFVTALSGETAYYDLFPDCIWRAADCDGDTDVDFLDIDPFVARIGS